jgi:hypothetical protein
LSRRGRSAGPTMEALRAILDPWLSKGQWKQTEGRVTFVCRFNSEDVPPIPLRLKVEINSREHFAMYGLKEIPFAFVSRWFEGKCQIHSYELDELLGTKLRALYQRKWGRDLFDLATALQNPAVNADRVVAAFSEYMKRDGHRVMRAQFEKNMAEKRSDPEFHTDIGPLLASGFTWDIETAAPVVSSRLIERLPCDPWKGKSGFPPLWPPSRGRLAGAAPSGRP